MSSSSFLIMFGSIWTGIVLFMTITMIMSNVPIGIMLIFTSVFWLIGLICLFLGIRKKVIDKRTDKYGEICFGQIKDIYFSGTSINGRREFKGDFLVYVRSEGGVRKVSEIVGFNPVDYPKNAYVKVKYFNRDINIEEVVSINNVPVNIREMLDAGPTPSAHLEEYSGYDYPDSDDDFDDGPISYK